MLPLTFLTKFTLIARIFCQYFPTLLDIHQTEFEVGYTSKVRTKETADAFVRSLVEIQSRSNDATYDESNSQVNGKQISFSSYSCQLYTNRYYQAKVSNGTK